VSSLADYLDKGASLGRDAPCLVEGDRTLSYGDVVELSHRIAGALARDGIAPGAKVGILSSNSAVAFACVFGIARRGAVWCPINPRNEAAENRALLALFDCECLIYHASYAAMAEQLDVPIKVRLDELDDWLGSARGGAAAPVDDLAMLAGTGGTTGLPKGVMLTSRNLETMTAMTLTGYPFSGRPAYLALAPLTHAAGVLCFPVMTLGGRIVVMPKPDVGEFIAAIGRERITHTFLPPTVIYMVLGHAAIATADLSSLQCFWYGAAPMSTARLEEALRVIGPMAQLFGQTEAPMMVSMLPPADHYDADGTVATERLASAGRPSPLTTVAIMDPETGRLVDTGERGEIVVRGSLVMAGYYKDPAATEEASRGGWHHTGDIGYLDADGYLFIVDRLKDMIITGGFNVYSAEVEQALMQHPAVRDCAVVGLPDDKWGERVAAVVEPGGEIAPEDLIAFVKARIGSVKAPKQVELWPELPRSRVGKVLKADVRTRLLGEAPRA
jgi:acyl-CoA synthetase (AMP-forming)/AMP-acid ligase II